MLIPFIYFCPKCLLNLGQTSNNLKLMTISLQFTAEEILLLIEALNLASIHSTDDILSDRMTIIQRKLESLRQINNEY